MSARRRKSRKRPRISRRVQEPPRDKSAVAAKPPKDAETGERERRRPLTFRQKLLLVAFGLFVVLLIEGSLRFLGVAAPDPLFLDVCPRQGDGMWVQANERYMEPFFARPIGGKQVRYGKCLQVVFEAPKPSDTIRVAFLGASTTLGYPHPRNNASSAFLEAMLNDCMVEGKRAEVLNLGYTAVASFCVARAARELRRAEPDLVVVYAGQNEFFGAYGILSSQFGGASTRAMAVRHALRNVRLRQVLAGLIDLLRGKPPPISQKHLIELMAARRLREPDGPEVAQAAANLETNLRAIAAHGRRLGVPTVFCTLVTNEKNLLPLASAEPDHLPPDKLALWRSAMTNGENLLTRSPREALEHLLTARSLYSKHARLNYRIGQARSALDDRAGALQAFTAARDYDCMPWRAPSAMNRAVRAAVGEDVILADVENAFREASDGEPFGWSLVVDHVHPSVRGQAIVARAVVNALAGSQATPWLDRTKTAALAPVEKYVRRLDNGDLGRFSVALHMNGVFSNPPFAQTNTQAVEYYKRVSQSLYDSFDEPTRRAAEELLAQPDSMRRTPIHFLAARNHAAAGQIDKALSHVAVAIRTADPYSMARLRALGLKFHCLRRFGDSNAEEIQATVRDLVARARVTLHLTRQPVVIHTLLASVYSDLGESDKAADEIVAAWDAGGAKQHRALARQLAEFLVAAGRRDEAVRYIREALRASPGNADLGRILSSLEGTGGPPPP